MAFGFSQPVDASVSVADAPNAPIAPTSETLFAADALAPSAYFVSTDTSAFKSLVFSFIFSGNPVFPANGDYCQIQMLWYSSTLTDAAHVFADNLLWVDTFEVPSRFTTGFTGPNKTFARLPVQGKVCVIAFNGGSGGAATPTLNIRVLGSNVELSKAVFGSDALNFKSTDLIVLSRSGGPLAPGVADTQEYGGLASGPALIRYVANFAAAGVSCRFRGFWGSDTVHGPEDIVLTSTAIGQTLSTSRLVQLPRRPLRMFAQNTTGAGNVNSYNFHVVRDEP